MKTIDENQLHEARAILISNSIVRLENDLADVQYQKDLLHTYGLSETGMFTQKSKAELNKLEKKEQQLAEKINQLSMQREILKPNHIPGIHREDTYDEWQVVANYEAEKEQDRIIKAFRETREQKNNEKDEIER